MGRSEDRDSLHMVPEKRKRHTWDATENPSAELRPLDKEGGSLISRRKGQQRN